MCSKANQIINYFDSNPKSGSLFTLLPMLFTYFQNLMIAYYAPNRQNENELAKFLDLRGAWAAREYIYRNEELYGRESDGDY